MARVSVPDPDAVLAALARRIDALEQNGARTGADVTALGRGVADLTAQIRHLANHPTTGAGADTQPDLDATTEEDSEGQPDWLAVTDPEVARQLLQDVEAWTVQVLGRFGWRLPAPCWPLHPLVVVELLALAAERTYAYAEERPTAVSEWLARWLPGAWDRISTALAACTAQRGHVQDGRTYHYNPATDGLDHATVAAWWATDRDAPAPAAFALTRL